MHGEIEWQTGYTESNRNSSDSKKCTPLSAIGSTLKLRTWITGAEFVSDINIFKVRMFHRTSTYDIQNTNRKG